MNSTMSAEDMTIPNKFLIAGTPASSDVLSRVKAFLPLIADANAELRANPPPADAPPMFDIVHNDMASDSSSASSSDDDSDDEGEKEKTAADGVIDMTTKKLHRADKTPTEDRHVEMTIYVPKEGVDDSEDKGEKKPNESAEKTTDKS